MTKDVGPVAEGLRERKKQQTRERIARTALELFDRDGFAETTIPAIAEAADVSPRTVSSYFPAKEDLVFPEAAETFGELGVRLRERGADETTADALRAWLGEQLPRWADKEPQIRAQRRVVDSDPGLQAYEQRIRYEAENMIAVSIADDLGASPDELEPRMAAAATFAIFGVFGDHKHAGDDGVHDRAEEGLQLLDRALRFVDAGIRALRDGQDTPFLRPAAD
jgi:AcrR family transcriptional regulator